MSKNAWFMLKNMYRGKKSPPNGELTQIQTSFKTSMQSTVNADFARIWGKM